jgi:DNA polymerase-3 subunit epsilon
MNDTGTLYAVVDLETTGGRPGSDRVIEIAIIIWDGRQVVSRYQTLVNPQRPIDHFVQDMTGIRDETVSSAPLFSDIAQEVWSLLEGKIFVAHNVRFDLGMLRREFARLGMPFFPPRLDTVTMAREAFPEVKSYSLGNICRHLHIEIYDRHRAMGDAEATVVLFEKICSHPQSDKILRIELNQGIDIEALPPAITPELIREFADEPGVLMAKDAKDNVLYVEGGSSGIQLLKRFIHLFSKSAAHLYEEVMSVTFEETGSELMAKLLMVNYRHRLNPVWNVPYRAVSGNWVVYTEKAPSGVMQLKVGKKNTQYEGLQLIFNTRSVANRVMQKILKDARYFFWVKTLEKTTETNQRESLLTTIEQKVMQAMQATIFPYPDFGIQLPGKTEDTCIWVIIQSNQLSGYRILPREYPLHNWTDLLETISPLPDCKDTHKYIRQYLRSKAAGRFLRPD